MLSQEETRSEQEFSIIVFQQLNAWSSYIENSDRSSDIDVDSLQCDKSSCIDARVKRRFLGIPWFRLVKHM